MGVYLSEPKTQKETKTDTSNYIRYTSAEMQGWRKNMEDSKITELNVNINNKRYCVFGVFDGHGGMEVSKFVEAHFVKQLEKNEDFKKGNIEIALEQLFCRMDEMLQTPEGNAELNEIRRKHQGEGMNEDKIGNNAGCTANVLVFDDENYYVANSGDSRSVLCRAGTAIALSEDHKPECQIEKSRIEKAGGVIMNGRVNGGLNLTRAMGDFEYKSTSGLGYKQQMITCHPDVKKVPRHSDDEFIIMGCDGIWQRYVNDSQLLITELVEKRKQQRNSTKLMEDLLDTLLAKSTMEEVGCDNMTAVLIEFLKG